MPVGVGLHVAPANELRLGPDIPMVSVRARTMLGMQPLLLVSVVPLGSPVDALILRGGASDHAYRQCDGNDRHAFRLVHLELLPR